MCDQVPVALDLNELNVARNARFLSIGSQGTHCHRYSGTHSGMATIWPRSSSWRSPFRNVSSWEIFYLCWNEIFFLLMRQATGNFSVQRLVPSLVLQEYLSKWLFETSCILIFPSLTRSFCPKDGTWRTATNWSGGRGSLLSSSGTTCALQVGPGREAGRVWADHSNIRSQPLPLNTTTTTTTTRRAFLDLPCVNWTYLSSCKDNFCRSGGAGCVCQYCFFWSSKVSFEQLLFIWMLKRVQTSFLVFVTKGLRVVSPYQYHLQIAKRKSISLLPLDSTVLTSLKKSLCVSKKSPVRA